MSNALPADGRFSWGRVFGGSLRLVFKTLVLISGLVIIWCCGSVFWLFDAGGATKGDAATFQAREFQRAIYSYQTKYGEYPKTLEDLVVEKDGRRPLMEGGLSALKDPWNNTFLFAIEPAQGDQPAEVLVWTISPEGERYEAIRRPWRE